eukprot:10833034-Alexandrium_andersonii.AAC.1
MAQSQHQPMAFPVGLPIVPPMPKHEYPMHQPKAGPAVAYAMPPHAADDDEGGLFAVDVSKSPMVGPPAMLPGTAIMASAAVQSAAELEQEVAMAKQTMRGVTGPLSKTQRKFLSEVAPTIKFKDPL